MAAPARVRAGLNELSVPALPAALPASPTAPAPLLALASAQHSCATAQQQWDFPSCLQAAAGCVIPANR